MAKKDDPQNLPDQHDSDVNTLSNPGKTPGPRGTNPFSEGRAGSTGGTGGVNPSAPTTGTEGWGLGDSEGDIGRVPSNTSPGPEGTHPGHEGGNLSFSCSEVHSSCDWEARGRDEDDIRRQVEQHGREHHNTEVNDSIWSRMRGLIRRRAA